MWRLNLAPQKPQYTFFKNGKIKLPPKPKKWSVLPLKFVYRHYEGEYCPIKLVQFDPGSRQKIVRWLKKYHDYDFPTFTGKGNPSVDPDSLEALGEEGALMRRYLKLVKDIGQLSEGDNSIIKSIRKDSTVKSRIDTNGANATGRFSSSSINLAQIPATKEFRELFSVPEANWLGGSRDEVY